MRHEPPPGRSKKAFDMKKPVFNIAAVLLIASCLVLAAGCGGTDPTNTPEPEATFAASPEPAAETSEPAAETPEPTAAAHGPDDPVDALFLGDSITKGNNFDEIFTELYIVDFGFGGATIEDLIGRVPEVGEIHPAKIFVLAGGNSLYSDNVEECVETFRDLLEALLDACPYAEIYVESMLPLDKAVAYRYDCPNRTIRIFNGRLSELAAEYGLTYIDLYPAYEKNGELNEDLTEDGIHLKDDAFGPWAEIVRPYLEP